MFLVFPRPLGFLTWGICHSLSGVCVDNEQCLCAHESFPFPSSNTPVHSCTSGFEITPRLQLHNMYIDVSLFSNVGVCELKLADLQPWDTSVAIFVQAHHTTYAEIFCILKYCVCLLLLYCLVYIQCLHT